MLTVDVSRRVVRFNQLHFRVKATPCRILILLLRNQGHVVSRPTIYREIWGYQFDPGTKVIDVQICYLRKLLKTLDAPVEIKTFRGKGLCLQVTVGKPA
ncbi:TPA: winged helix-turn-helix transcriptional regulator [Pseudomonas putida]|nr:winged helix-turn-helix transcriptional regulator [Pseudomonas putida]HEN8717682.1 winged helix-turn-helix transcriptional regulator [Pseudomonas putida]